jgi:hypothetical protein
MNMGSLDCRWALDTADAGSHADVAGRCARAHAHRTDARSDWGSAGHSQVVLTLFSHIPFRNKYLISILCNEHHAFHFQYEIEYVPLQINYFDNILGNFQRKLTPDQSAKFCTRD